MRRRTTRCRLCAGKGLVNDVPCPCPLGNSYRNNPIARENLHTAKARQRRGRMTVAESGRKSS